MNVPLTMMAITLLVALTAFLFRKRAHVSAWMAAGGTFLLGLLVLVVPLEEAFDLAILQVRFDNEFVLLGRSLLLDEPARGFIGFLFLLAGVLLASSTYSKTNRFFSPLIVLLSAILAAAMMMKPFLYAAILMELAAIVAVLVLAAPEYPARRAGMRLLFVYTLAMMAILLAGWLLGVVGVTGATPEIARWTAALLALGFAVLMAIPPFHYWLSVAADESHPYVVVTLLLFMQTVGVFFLLRFLDTYEWFRIQSSTYDAMRFIGIGMGWFGAFMMLGQVRMTRVLAYALIMDMGVVLMAASMADQQGLELMMQFTAARVPAVVLWAMNLTSFIRVVGDDTHAKLTGAAHRHRWRSLFLLLGMVLAFGVPFSPVFPGRWVMVQHFASTDLLVLATMFAMWIISGSVVLRWYRILHAESAGNQALVGREAEFYLSCILLGTTFLVGMFPQLVLPWMEGIVQGLSNLIP